MRISIRIPVPVIWPTSSESGSTRLPHPDLTLDPDGVCSPVATSMSAGIAAGYTCTWNFGDGTSYNTDSSFMAHTFYNTGTRDTVYRVSLRVSSPNGCSANDSSEIVVYPNPRADFFVSPVIQNYPADTVILANFSSDGNWNYLWTFGDGNSSPAKQPGSHVYQKYGDYAVTLTTFSAHCADSISRTIRILPPPPVAGFKPDTAGCSPLTVTFNNESLYGETFVWDFDDGSYSNEKDPVHTFYTSRDYEVKLLVSGIRGSSEAKHTIRVYPFPRAGFNAYPDSATRQDQVFKFINTSEKAAEYQWDLGDGSLSYQESPSHVYGREGYFDVSLIVWSAHGCPDTLMRPGYIRIVAGEGEIHFPNVFKWNGSGPTGGYWTPGTLDNTVFHPFFENVEDYTLLIYDRWGELLYTSDDVFKGWDGYIMNGARATQGVYVYKALVRYVDGTQEVKVGDVTFLH